MSAPDSPASLNQAQKLHLLASYQYADKLLSEIESIISAAYSRSAFPRYRPDLAPVQVKIIEDYLARLRDQMVRALSSLGVERPEAQFGALHAIRVTLGFLDIAFEECRPKRMRGYGELPDSLLEQMNGAVDELQGLVSRLNAFLAEGVRQDLAARLERLERTAPGLEDVKLIERIVRERGLVEFRPALAALLERLESGNFEIAVFGRVSSGKSSLLNHVLGMPVLPVGVTPVTAVPTRILYGPTMRGRVWLAGDGPQEFPVERLPEFVSEELNPGNRKHVTRLLIEVPSARLRQGVVFVDTPGLGSLAEAGARETRAYLPHCDLGVLLVDASSTLTPDDLATLEALYEAGVTTQVLLSKADLLAPPERERLAAYISEAIRSSLGWNVAVQAVSVKPGYEAAAEAWFEAEIQPLYERFQELSQSSLRRKIAVLRDGVQAALEARVRRLGGAPAVSAPMPELESALRVASGWFSDAQESCLRITDEVRLAADAALRRAARAMTGKRGLLAGEAAQVLDRALRQAAVEAADKVAAVLEGLAEETTRVLRHAAEDLVTPDNVPAENELLGALEGMPRWELGGLPVEVKVNRWLLRISPALEQARLTRSLRATIGELVRNAFNDYGKALAAWSRSTVLKLRSQFESYAEAYRAQLRVVAGGSDDLAALERDLAELAAHGGPSRGQQEQAGSGQLRHH